MKRTRDLYGDESSSSESEEFHREKIRVKVKLPEERSEDEDESPQPQRKHFCVICEKQFSSGKAYGGHVRIHSIEYNNKGKMKKMKKMKLKKKKKRKIGLVKKEKEKEIDLARTDVEGKIRCCLCGKEFQTMHSLFGHMRRHPDRTWKGIRPPPPSEKFNLSYLDDDVDDEDEDDDDVMSRSMMMSDVPEDVQGAACILMMLSYASRNYWAGIEESPKSEVRSSSFYKDDEGKDKVLGDSRMDEKKGLIVDMKIKMEMEVKVNSPRDEAKRSLGFDLNQPPYHEDHP
ncbi:C2H2-type zinc finger family protein [Arabidopsis thaliana]|uniref:C2H2-type zinc finger family protein n=1 Tax=Arabidopsis thaliana TaxID=3702 RepID=O81013_ARATH|nr:C2H2-type zinc finger family protein [Arabidopsis thaliana]AAC32249.1 putative C2H2-type zinc finger protein [Arabidopsis thaliana]AEC07909.1 C2H2-type zinc finger family protein [Arabidopsis thaliana]|eukprot:NP_180262.1 C2H2-type zinc finger family protein [Arabidopsis thaliana]